MPRLQPVQEIPYPTLHSLHLPPLASCSCHALMLTYKTLSVTAPSYLNSLLKAYVTSCNRRSISDRRFSSSHTVWCKVPFQNLHANCSSAVECTSNLNPDRRISHHLQKTAKDPPLP
ncbi:hypothetical protein AMELA_G00005190 [Ameiurus melas]|uniref:Uncharacterized protein n=1 Tax=Ameiurus melas TaxID=219545 RepID=A0A7J6BF40_AMEME|nr:hypothetical protein AMELA_G00005190 [Ameiurus melas]